MVGNVAEWIADWSLPFTTWGTFSDDGSTTSYATDSSKLGIARGGGFDEGANVRDAGPFSFGSANLSIGSQYVGFRAAR
jgi:formylglycine-generating enzyme required for sulfatase activity